MECLEEEEDVCSPEVSSSFRVGRRRTLCFFLRSYFFYQKKNNNRVFFSFVVVLFDIKVPARTGFLVHFRYFYKVNA
jgi:hypothetical protein